MSLALSNSIRAIQIPQQSTFVIPKIIDITSTTCGIISDSLGRQ